MSPIDQIELGSCGLIVAVTIIVSFFTALRIKIRERDKGGTGK